MQTLKIVTTFLDSSPPLFYKAPSEPGRPKLHSAATSPDILPTHKSSNNSERHIETIQRWRDGGPSISSPKDSPSLVPGSLRRAHTMQPPPFPERSRYRLSVEPVGTLRERIKEPESGSHPRPTLHRINTSVFSLPTLAEALTNSVQSVVDGIPRPPPPRPLSPRCLQPHRSFLPPFQMSPMVHETASVEQKGSASVPVAFRQRRDSLLDPEDGLETLRLAPSSRRRTTLSGPPLSSNSVVSRSSSTDSRESQFTFTDETDGQGTRRQPQRNRILSAAASPAEVCHMEIESRWQIQTTTRPKSALEPCRSQDDLRAHLQALACTTGRAQVARKESMTSYNPASISSSPGERLQRAPIEAELVHLIPPPPRRYSTCTVLKARKATTTLLRTPTQYIMPMEDSKQAKVRDSSRASLPTPREDSEDGLICFDSDLDDAASIEAHVSGSADKSKDAPLQASNLRPSWWRSRRGWPGTSRKSHSIANMESLRRAQEGPVEEEEEEDEQAERYIGLNEL